MRVVKDKSIKGNAPAPSQQYQQLCFVVSTSPTSSYRELQYVVAVLARKKMAPLQRAARESGVRCPMAGARCVQRRGKRHTSSAASMARSRALVPRWYPPCTTRCVRRVAMMGQRLQCSPAPALRSASASCNRTPTPEQTMCVVPQSFTAITRKTSSGHATRCRAAAADLARDARGQLDSLRATHSPRPFARGPSARKDCAEPWCSCREATAGAGGAS